MGRSIMSILKGAVIFLTGVGVGGTASYLYFQKKYDEKKEELNELKEHYNKKIFDDIDKKIVEDIIEKEKYVSYAKMTPEILKETVDKKVEEAAMTDHPKEPFVIDEIEYSEKELYFDKIELDYFTEDEALLDEADDLVDINTSIGYDILDDFIKDENEDIIYIRNPVLNTDYMVNKRFGKYSDIVGLGGDENDE